MISGKFVNYFADYVRSRCSLRVARLAAVALATVRMTFKQPTCITDTGPGKQHRSGSADVIFYRVENAVREFLFFLFIYLLLVVF